MIRAAVMCAAVLVAAASALPAHADPPSTQVITVAPIGPNGEPANGYHEAAPGSSVAAVSDCTQPSPSAVGDDIYSCSPSAADAGTCWPATRESLLCIDDPWAQQLHRVSYGGQLPHVQPPATADPFALLLDDGTRCLFRNGGASGGRADGYLGVYGCGGPGSNLAVLWLPSRGPGSCIDRSAPVWTVQVGQLGSPADTVGPPQARNVASAWFAGDPAG